MASADGSCSSSDARSTGTGPPATTRGPSARFRRDPTGGTSARHNDWLAPSCDGSKVGGGGPAARTRRGNSSNTTPAHTSSRRLSIWSRRYRQRSQSSTAGGTGVSRRASPDTVRKRSSCSARSSVCPCVHGSRFHWSRNLLAARRSSWRSNSSGRMRPAERSAICRRRSSLAAFGPACRRQRPCPLRGGCRHGAPPRVIAPQTRRAAPPRLCSWRPMRNCASCSSEPKPCRRPTCPAQFYLAPAHGYLHGMLHDLRLFRSSVTYLGLHEGRFSATNGTENLPSDPAKIALETTS